MQTRQDYTLRISVLSFMGEVRDYKKMQKFEAMQKQKQFFFLLTIDHSFKPAEQDLRGTISKLTALV